MRHLSILFILFACRTATASAGEVPALVRPAGLSRIGVKLWATLIEGRPQWKNWVELMDHEPLHRDARAQMQIITGAVNDQLGEHRRPLFRSAVGQVFRALERSPDLRALGLDGSNPAQAVRDSFRRFQRGLPTAVDTPFPIAHARALAFVRTRDRVVGADTLTDDQEREVAALTWKFLRTPHPRPSYPSAADFERWKAAYRHESSLQNDREGTVVMRALLADADQFAKLRFVRVDPVTGARENRKLDAWYSPATLPAFGPADEVPAHLGPALESLHPHSYALFAVDATGALLAIDHFDHDGHGPEPDVEDLYDVGRLVRRRGLDHAHLMSTLRDRYFGQVADRLIYDGPRTQDVVDRVTAAPTAEPYHFRDDADWFFECFTRLENQHEASFACQWMPHARKTIWAWQIAARGFDFWRDQVADARASDLPELPLIGDHPDDYYDGDGRPLPPDDGRDEPIARPPPGFIATLLASSRVRGNHQIDDVDERFVGFRLTRGSLPRGIGPFRLPSIETADDLPRGRFSLRKPDFTLTAVNPTAKRVIQTASGRSILLVPAPAGYAPTLSSWFGTRGWFGRRILALTDLDVRHDPVRGLFAVDLGDGVKTADAVIGYVADPAWREGEASAPLAFTRAQLAPVVQYLDEIEARPLARALAVAGASTAAGLARLVGEYSVYSVDERTLGPGGIGDFVTRDGLFAVQCGMAAEVLKQLLARALADHPLRDRVRLEIAVTMPLHRPLVARPVLTTPLHAVVDVTKDGRLVESLDATPWRLEERVPDDPSVPVGIPVQARFLLADHDVKLERAIAHVRAAVAGLEVPPVDPSIPTFALVREAETLRRTGGDLSRLKRMEEWVAGIDRMAAYRTYAASPSLDRQSGANVLLSAPAVAAAHRVVEASRAVLMARCASALSSR